MKFKLDLTNKKLNLIVTAIILAVGILVGVVTSIDFVEFYNYRTYWNGERDVIDHVEHLSQYSPNLKGKSNDVEIYVSHGSNNTVALVQASKLGEYDTVEKIAQAYEDNNCQIIADTVHYTTVADQQALTLSDHIVTKATAQDAINAAKGGGVGLVSYATAKQAIAADDTLAISQAKVEMVPSMLVMGGTHPNEPSGQMTAILFLENVVMQRGTIYIIPEINRSAYSYSTPQEAQSWYFTIPVYNDKGEEIGQREFKFGSRLTNVKEQWPVPDVYTHSSGQQLSQNEIRNLNRSFPGSPDGTYTEMTAWGVTNLLLQNDITIEIDLHEASPEYLTNNALIYHQDSKDIYNRIRLNPKAFRYPKLDEMGNEVLDKDSNPVTNRMVISMEESPENMHGLSHRELGDYSNSYVFLLETCDAAEGRIRGAFTPDLITYYNHNDKFYEHLAKLDAERGITAKQGGYLYVPPVSIDVRVARHAFTITTIVDAYNKIGFARSSYGNSFLDESLRHQPTDNLYRGSFVMEGIPSYNDIVTKGTGSFLYPQPEGTFSK